MRLISRWNVAIIIATLCFALLPDTGLGQTDGRIRASSDLLEVNGWRMIMPSVSVDEGTGQTWVRYDLPGGAYESYPLGAGEAIAEKWYKPGVEGFNTTPAGYSIEDTEAIKNWYMDGGVGEFIVEDGNWTAVDPASDDSATADSDSPSVADNPATTTPTADDADSDNPTFGGGRVDPNAIQSVSTAPDSSGPDADLRDLLSRYNAAKKLCSEQPSNENCERYYKIEAEYLQRMQGN